MANNILEMALERLEPNFSPSTISAWFDDVTVVSFADNRLILHSPVQFKKEIIEQRFIDPLQNVLQELLGCLLYTSARPDGQRKAGQGRAAQPRKAAVSGSLPLA